MKKSLAKLSFKPVAGSEDKFKIPPGPTWFTPTWGCEPNDWSVRIQFIENPRSDNTIMAEIDFLMEGAAYLLVPGTKFKLFGGFTQFECTVEIIKAL